MIFVVQEVSKDRKYRDYFNSQETQAVKTTLFDVTSIGYTKVLTAPDKVTEDLKKQLDKVDGRLDLADFSFPEYADFEWYEVLVLAYKRRGSEELEVSLYMDATLLERNERTLDDRVVFRARTGPKKKIDSDDSTS